MTALELSTDPERASFEAAAHAGLGPLDAHELLALDDTSERFSRLERLLGDAADILELRLSGA